MTPPPQAPVHLRVVLAGVLAPEGLLLIRRRKPPYQGLWGLPGGKIEPGESAPAAVARELREECGIQVDDLRPLGRLVERLDEADGRRFLFDLHLFRVDLEEPTPVAAGGEGRVAFHPLDRLETHEGDYIPTDLLIIRHMILPESCDDHETWVVADGREYVVHHFRRRG